jgi:predicted RNA-binding Zn ribbon-like protein
MSGWTIASPRDPAPAQPGGRRPAPGVLAIVQSFINSHYDLEVNRGADLLASARGLRDWLLERELIEAAARVGADDLARALTAREALRDLARGNAGSVATEALNRAAAGAGVELRFTDDGPRFVRPPRAEVPAAIGLILAYAAGAMIEGTWERLKICPGDHCGWAFYDHSRNRTGRWCSMSVCGGRAKARAHYRRHQQGGERN